MKVLLIEMRVKGKMSHLLPIIADFPLSEIRDQKFGHGLSDLHLKHWMNMVRTDLKSTGSNLWEKRLHYGSGRRAGGS